MLSLSTGDYRHVLELVGEALLDASPEFPSSSTTGLLVRVFEADFAGAGDIDLRGTASRTWADVPGPRSSAPQGFHAYARQHPLAKALLRPGGGSAPLRLSDIASLRDIQQNTEVLGAPHQLAVPLEVTPQHMGALVVMRSGSDFTVQNLVLATQLQPVLAGVYHLRDRVLQNHRSAYDTDTGIPLSGRELGVLDLMACGLIAAAIGRRLGISPRTVGKHIESIYRKLGTRDRTTAVLRAHELGALDIAAREYTAPVLPGDGPMPVHPRGLG